MPFLPPNQQRQSTEGTIVASNRWCEKDVYSKWFNRGQHFTQSRILRLTYQGQHRNGGRVWYLRLFCCCRYPAAEPLVVKISFMFYLLYLNIILLCGGSLVCAENSDFGLVYFVISSVWAQHDCCFAVCIETSCYRGLVASLLPSIE